MQSLEASEEITVYLRDRHNYYKQICEISSGLLASCQQQVLHNEYTNRKCPEEGNNGTSKTVRPFALGSVSM